MEEQKRFLALDIGDAHFMFAFFEVHGKTLNTILWGREETGPLFLKHSLESVWQTIQQQYLVWKQNNKNAADKVILTLSPSVCKSSIMRLGLKRKDPRRSIDAKEEQSIMDETSHGAEKKMKEALFEKHGIHENDFVLQNLEVLKTSIDGYVVSHLQGCTGAAIEFEFLGTFLPFVYKQRIQSLISLHQLGEPIVAHEVQLLRAFSKAKRQDGVFIDVGDSMSLITVMREGELCFVKEVAWGVDALAKSLEHAFGMEENIAREFRETYAKGGLSEEVRKKVRELFLPEMKIFGRMIRESLEAWIGVFPSLVFLFGEGFLMPELLEIIESDAVQGLSFIDVHEVSLFLPTRIAEVQNFSQASNPLYTTLFLEYYYAAQ